MAWLPWSGQTQTILLQELPGAEISSYGRFFIFILSAIATSITAIVVSLWDQDDLGLQPISDGIFHSIPFQASFVQKKLNVGDRRIELSIWVS